MVQLKGYKINSINFENKVKPGIQLQLNNQVKYNVNYLSDGKTCVGIVNFKVSDSNMNPFEIKVELVAEFNFDSADDRADIHVNSFDQIFPFLRQIINNITSMSGMPGLMIPIMKLKKESVEMGNNPPQPPSDNNQGGPLN